MVSVPTGESSEEVSAPSPALAQAKAQSGTKSRTAKASLSAWQQPELKLIFDELPAEHSLRAIPQNLVS